MKNERKENLTEVKDLIVLVINGLSTKISSDFRMPMFFLKLMTLMDSLENATCTSF